MSDFFAYDAPNDGVFLTSTAEEAEAEARAAIEAGSDGDLHDRVDQVCWGRVLGRARLVVEHEHEPGAPCMRDDAAPECSAGLRRDLDFLARVDLVAVSDPLAERVAELEAELQRLQADVARLRIRAEAREAQLRHAQARLNRLRQPAMDVPAIFSRLKGSGAAWDTRFWDGLGEAEARVIVAEGRAAEVDAAMLEIGLYPVGVPVPEGDGMVHGYSTDGTPPWEASDEAGGAR